MKKITVNFIVDSIGFVVLLGIVYTGVIIKYVLPPGSGGHGHRGGRGGNEVKELWDMTRHEWGDIHFYLSLAFIVIIIVHLVLHFKWIKSYFQNIGK